MHIQGPPGLVLLGLLVYSCVVHAYPASLLPLSSSSPALQVLFAGNMSDGETLAMETLSGLTSRVLPGVYVVPEGANAAAHMFWLRDMESRLGIELNWTAAVNETLVLYREMAEVDRFIVADVGTSNTLAAYALCGIEGVIATTEGMVQRMVELGFTLVGDARGMRPQDVFEDASYRAAMSDAVLVYQAESKFPYLAGYAVFAGAFAFDAPLNSSLAREVLSSPPAFLRENAALLGWGTSEIGLVSRCSRDAVLVNAADYAANLAVMSNLEVRYSNSFVQRVEPDRSPAPSKHAVAFLFTDGDNTQWLQNGFANAASWYGSPDRGKTHIGWTMTPAAQALVPNIMSYAYAMASDSATASDYFVCAPSGAGYVYPSLYERTALSEYVDETVRFMNRTDMRIVNIIDPGVTSPANRSAIVAATQAFAQSGQVDAVFLYPYSDYSLLNGSVTFVDGVPVIGGRANLWKGFNNATQMAERLNKLASAPEWRNPRDPSRGYSLIPVHVWSMGTKDVVATAQLLDTNLIEVVSPATLVARMRAHATSVVQRSRS